MKGRPVRALSLGALLILSSATAWARSPAVTELATWFTRYHENPARLDALKSGLETAVTTDADVETLIALAEVSFLWGDVRAATGEQKLLAYDRGRQAAQRAVELAPRSAVAHFWYATNTARWGQTKGITRSLFLLPTVKEEIRIVLDLDPTFTPAYALAGNVFYEVPPLLGGDLERAEAMFRTGLLQDPKFTGLRVGLAKVLARRGHLAEAVREAETVLSERAPTNPADWTVKDAPEARQLLQSFKRELAAERASPFSRGFQAPTPIER